MHTYLGYLAGIFTIVAGFIALKVGGWEINMNSSLHSKLGFSTFVMGLVLVLGGFFANLFRLSIRMPWKTNQALFPGKVHKWFGRLLVIFSQAANATGFYHFYSKKEDYPLAWALGGITLGIFFMGLIVGEIYFQCKLRQDFPTQRPDTIMK